MSKKKPAPAPPTAPEWAPPIRQDLSKSNRKVFLFTEEEVARLEDFARAYSVTEAAVVRTALKFYFAAAPDEQPDPTNEIAVEPEAEI